jgi:hypothetical protein
MISEMQLEFFAMNDPCCGVVSSPTCSHTRSISYAVVPGLPMY